MPYQREEEDFVEVDCTVRAETGKALLIYDGKKEVWIPKSQIEEARKSKDGKINRVTLPEWLATDKGLT